MARFFNQPTAVWGAKLHTEAISTASKAARPLIGQASFKNTA